MPLIRLVGRWEPVPPRRCQDGAIWPVPLRPRIAAVLSVADCGVSGIVDFLIDTGADQTVLMPDDISALGITSRHLAEGCPPASLGVGGTPVPLKYLRNVSAEFQAADDTIEAKINLQRVAVLFPSRAARRNGSGSSYRGMPSLLGRSFLNLCHIELSRDNVLLDYEAATDA